MADYYQLLGVPANASEVEIRAAYRKKAKLYHPDVNKAPDAHAVFVLLTSAYETLINPHKRERYNARSSKSNSGSGNGFQTYQEWVKVKKARAEHEAKIRYYEFLKNREKFRTSKYYHLAIVVTHVARIVAYFFGAGIIGICLYIMYDFHFIFLFLLLPFICGGIYLIKWTDDWFQETKRYF
jgi:curved DNA-binding protein CbpA